ncbi:MAG: hypothetical protein GF364_21375, partial [Candidatus Lokiarchaeota archaeon]|nr:hypothetical protein [Candidatus Lokiarchaeota archaeon]
TKDFQKIDFKIPDDKASKVLVKHKMPVHVIIDIKSVRRELKDISKSDTIVKFLKNELTDFDIKILGKEGITEWVEIPLLSAEDTLIGKISIDNKNRKDLIGELDQEFSPWDLALLTVFTRFASLAIQLAKLQEKQKKLHQRKEDEINAIQTIDESLLTGQKEDDLLELILEKAFEIIKPCSAIIRKWDDKEHRFKQCLQKKNFEWPGNIPVELEQGSGLSGLAVKKRKMVELKNGSSEKWWIEFVNSYIGEERIFLEKIESGLACPLFFRKQILGSIAVAKDIVDGFDENDKLTLRILANEASAVLEYANLQNAKVKFAMSNTHALRGPLVAMGGYVEMIRDNLVDSDAERIKYCNIVLEGVGSLNQMTSELIRTTQIETGFEHENNQFSVWNSIRNVIAKIEAYAGVKIRLIKRGDYDYISGAQDRFEEAIRCLVDNAIKYTKRKPRITILKTNRDNRIIIKVADNGVGITRKDLQNIHERFFRGSHSKRMNYEEIPGTGLGVYVSKEFIEDMNGNISYKSKPRKWTVVTVSFPRENQ